MRLAVRFGPPADVTPPLFLSGTSGSVNESATLAFTITTNEVCTFAITGGADAAEFELSSAGPAMSTILRWASNGTQDYEAPADADMDNDYLVTVTATDASGNASLQSITISVTDVVATAAQTFYILGF